MKDISYDYIAFAIKTEFNDLSAHEVKIVSQCVLDYLGNVLGGSGDITVRRIYDTAIKYAGGGGPCHLIGFGDAVPVQTACFLNATMGFALDFDDTHEGATCHLSIGCIPTAFAVSEIRETPVTGKEFITAVALGMELTARLGMSINRRWPLQINGGWDFTSLHGIFGATVTAGKLLGLTADQMHDALGIAYHQAAGNTLSAVEEADTKKMGPGFATSAAVFAALLAKNGVTGCRSVFNESDYSLFTQYHAGGHPDIFLKDLGTFVFTQTGFKPYPCCLLSHRFIDTLRNIVRHNQITSKEILAIRPTVCSRVNIQLCNPRENKIAPKSRDAAIFSLPWLLASAVVRGTVDAKACVEENLKNKEVLDLAQKVEPIYESSLESELVPSLVTVVTNRGEFSEMTGIPYGSYENPMSWEELEEKFWSNQGFGIKPFDKVRLHEGISFIHELAELEDMQYLLRNFL